MKNGFSLIELVICTALSFILLTALSSCFIQLVKSYQMQQVSNNLYDQANFFSSLFKKNLANTGNLDCQIFQHNAQINNQSDFTPLTHSGFMIFQIDSDTIEPLVPPNIKKKLLAHSVLIVSEGIQPPLLNARYDQQNHQFIFDSPVLEKNQLILLSNCQHAWLIRLYPYSQQKFTPTFSIADQTGPYKAGAWQTTLWFAMKNNQNHYGVYQLTLPKETTPVEIMSDVIMFQANAIIDGQSIAAHADLDWTNIHLVRINIELEKNHSALHWPISILIHPAIEDRLI